MNTQKKIAAINDLSGYGHCSLTVALPILSVMGHQCCPVPTAILSNHTGFSNYYFEDFTDRMAAYAGEWETLGLRFDGIATGFLGSAPQVAVVEEIIRKLRTPETMVIVDPAMGDDGSLYATCTAELAEEMKNLVGLADVALPNVTECCLLTGTPYKESFNRKELLDMAMKLRLMGAKAVVITGVREGNFLTNVVLDQGKEEAEFIRMKNAGVSRPGTGDVFASVFAGAALNGDTPAQAAKKAARFVKDCIKRSDERQIPLLNGVCFEELLGNLLKR